MIEKIALIVEYVLLVIAALSLIMGVIAPIIVLIHRSLVNLAVRIFMGITEPVMNDSGAPFILMIGLMITLSAFTFALFIDVVITRYYFN